MHHRMHLTPSFYRHKKKIPVCIDFVSFLVLCWIYLFLGENGFFTEENVFLFGTWEILKAAVPWGEVEAESSPSTPSPEDDSPSEGDSSPVPPAEPSTGLTGPNGAPVSNQEFDNIVSHPAVRTQSNFAFANELIETNSQEATKTLKAQGVKANEVDAVKAAVKEGLDEANKYVEKDYSEKLSTHSAQRVVRERENDFREFYDDEEAKENLSTLLRDHQIFINKK